MQKNYEYDAVVVSSGPNGLACAIQLQRSGLSVLLIEGSEQIGGGMRSKEFFPGYLSDEDKQPVGRRGYLKRHLTVRANQKNLV